jgi:hypothetical protein
MVDIDDWNETILVLKQKIKGKIGVEVEHQRLAYAGKPLRDGNHLVALI